ncbi:MAG: class I SAM-dependent methyltransferase [Kiritimatiellia bacterium]
MALELNYSTLAGQESMLRDSVRCKAFQQAITAAVTPGCTVLDIGAGTGILSLFAAQAGAGHVYAVEQTQIVDVARRIIATNGFSDRITVIQGDITKVELPEKVDVIVSEWLGSYAVDENLLPVVVQARERWLKPGGRMIPGSVKVWMSLAFDEFLQQEVDFWRSEPYGLDLELISQNAARRMDCFCNHINQKHLLCEPQLMWNIDCQNCPLELVVQPWNFRSQFMAEREGEFNVLAAWFQANLFDEIGVTNGPSDPDTHWGRQIFPVGKNLFLKSGSEVEVDFTHEPRGTGESRALWSIKQDDYHFNSEGTTLLVDK